MCIEANPSASSVTPNANRDRRKLSPGSSARIAAAALTANAEAQAQTAATPIGSKPPRILVIWGDDIGIRNISHNSRGMMGFMTPNIDRIAREGVCFTDYYGQQSCTAGRPVFIGGNLSKIEESPKRAR